MNDVILRNSIRWSLVALLSCSGLFAQDGTFTIFDEKASEEALTYSDALSFRAWSTGDDLVFEVEMQRAHKEGVFTCLHVYINSDNRPTGQPFHKPSRTEGGADVWLRASIGSRYHPNRFEAKGQKPAMKITRASMSHFQMRTWIHREVLAKPVIGERTIRFQAPLREIMGAGTSTASIMGIRAMVETSCTDQPLMIRHVCKDRGIKITLDGTDNDWSQPRSARDAKGELHEIAQSLDLERLRVEHDEKNIFVCVEMAATGFREDDLISEDIRRLDKLTFFIEPMYPRYQLPLKAVVACAKRYRKGAVPGTKRKWSSSAGGKLIEFMAPRTAGQNSFRVWVWSDMLREDYLGDYRWTLLDWKKVTR